jgi:hypothetical protein
MLVLKGWWCMNLRRELLTFSRSCEHLLSLDVKVTDEERSLVEYYVNELSRELLSDQPAVRLRYTETVTTNRASAT